MFSILRCFICNYESRINFAFLKLMEFLQLLQIILWGLPFVEFAIRVKMVYHYQKIFFS